MRIPAPFPAQETRRRAVPDHPQRRRARRGPRTSVLAPFRAIIARVPRGKVVTYGQVAEAAGFPRAGRMTVWALHHSEGLPWHRVVASGGRIALPEERGREQRLRLELEGVTFRGDRVQMAQHTWEPTVRERKIV